MSQASLEKFGAYQKAMQMFDLVAADMVALRADGRCYRLVSQQVGSADSIAANIEEGYGRLSRAEYVRFLDFARASARETRGRYQRMKHWLPQDVIVARVALADEIIGILTASIERLRSDMNAGQSRTQGVKETATEYDCEPCPSLDPPPSTLFPRPSGDSCLILLAHGSRNPNWRAPFDALLETLRTETGEDRIHLAYMQMASPSLTDVVETLVARGAGTIRVLPLLMSAGNHAYEDIPAEVTALRAKHPGLAMEVLPPIGSHPRFKAMLRELVKETL